jgi:hypothetical protein
MCAVSPGAIGVVGVGCNFDPEIDQFLDEELSTREATLGYAIGGMHRIVLPSWLAAYRGL